MRRILGLSCFLLACSNPSPNPSPSPSPTAEPVAVEPPPAAPVTEDPPANPDAESGPVEIARVDGDAVTGGKATATLGGAPLELVVARDKTRVNVTGTYGGSTHALGSCDASKPLRVEAEIDGPHVHVLCIVISPEGKPTWTNGSRFRWGAGAKKFEPAGGYEGEGRVDPATIDLDE